MQRVRVRRIKPEHEGSDPARCPVIRCPFLVPRRHPARATPVGTLGTCTRCHTAPGPTGYAGASNAGNPDRSFPLPAAIEPYTRLLVAQGLDAAFVCGTTGEGMSLSLDERMAVAARWREVAPNDLDVIGHVGHTALPDARTFITVLGAFGGLPAGKAAMAMLGARRGLRPDAPAPPLTHACTARHDGKSDHAGELPACAVPDPVTKGNRMASPCRVILNAVS